MAVIKIRTSEHRLEKVRFPKLTSGSVDVDYVQVELDRKWSDLELSKIYASFWIHEDEDKSLICQMDKISDTVYQCTIPPELLQTTGELHMGIYAENEEGLRIKTSDTLSCTIYQGTYLNGKKYTASLPIEYWYDEVIEQW